jgi:hypothetical protein
LKQEKYPKLAPILLTSLILASIGWIGLYFLILYTQPLLGPRWLFFFLLTVAVSGSVLPVAYFLNLRFPSIPPAGAVVLIRQSIWVGVFFDLIAWLQLGRVLNPVLATVLAIGVLVIENLIRMLERSRWRPSRENNE